MKSIFKTFFLSLCIIANTHLAFAQTASILPPAKTTFVDQNGKPLTAGQVFSYIPGTTTFKTTWQDAAETIANTNPVVLDAAGRALLLGSGSYRQIVKDINNNVIWDQVTSSTGSSSGGGSTATGDGDLVGTIKPWAGTQAPNQYMFTYGQELSRTTFAPLLAAITSSQSIFCNNGSPILSGLSDTNSFWVGMPIEVACVAAGNTTVISKTVSTVTMAVNANATQNVTAVFFPWGRGNGTTTFNLPDFRGFTLAGNNIMGGVSGNQLSVTFFGVQDPNSAGAAGGSQSRVIQLSNVPTGITSTATVVSTATNIPSNTSTGGTATGAQNTPVWIGSVVDGSITSNGTATSNNTGQGSAASAVVAAGGSGYTTGTQLLTVSGGTCTVQPTFNVTVSAGAITTPVLANAGLCTVAPSNPASTTGGGGTGGTLTVTYGQAPISTVQPTKTTNYIIKVTPDTNSATASGVTSLGFMTGDIACGFGLLCTGNNISVSSSISPPTPTTLGGVFSKTCPASNWFSQLDTTGTYTCSQPNFTDLSGVIALAQISANLITYAKLQQGTALSIVGNSTNAATNLADIVAAADGNVLRRSGTVIGFGSINLASGNAVTGLLSPANGGTGINNSTNTLTINGNSAITPQSSGFAGWTAGTISAIGATILPVANGGTALASGISGGILCFTATGTLASSVLQTANAIMIGGGAGVCPSPLGSLGTITTLLHGNAAGPPSYGPVALATDISGLGTNVATAAGTTLSAAGGLTSTIASGTSAMGIGAISSATCATVVTTTATNTATTDVVLASFNGDPTAATGYIPSTSGMLTIIAYPTVNNVNFKVCNNTISSITPSAITLNWRVLR